MSEDMQEAFSNLIDLLDAEMEATSESKYAIASNKILDIRTVLEK